MSEQTQQRATILIVDDLPENIEILGGVISGDYTVKVATSGRKALQLAESVQPDLILLDIMMPEMDGYQVCAALKQNPLTSEIPVIFITALGESGNEERGFEVGCVDYLTKPINPPIALARVRTQLALRRAQRELQMWNNSLQAKVMQDYRRQTAQLKLYEMDQVTCNDMLDAALEDTIALTGSSIGYIYQYDEDTQLFMLYAWSQSVMPECSIIHKQTVCELEKTGLWGEAVRKRMPIITNEYDAANPLKQGYPEGHVHLVRHLNLPIFRHQKIVAVVGVGNKPSDYTDDDVRQLELFLNATWNIVERIKAQEELQAARSVAEEASRMKSELLANISHELRTPLNGIIGGAQLLQFTDLTEEQQSYLQMIDESSANELALVNNLLELVRLESEGIVLENRAFGLQQLLDDTVKLYEGAARLKGIELLRGMGADCPEQVIGDRIRLQQILHCLLGNAIKFTDQGRVTLSLSCERTASDRLLARFSVQDTGVGIEPDKLERIFDLFVQSDMSNTRRFGGLGLGLAICRRLIDTLGGKIWAEGEPGNGSTFHVELLLELPDEVVGFPDRQRVLDILVAEDDPLSAKTTEGLLKKLGYTVKLALNGAEAVELWKRTQPDLLLMDIQMPVMSGFEALHQVRSLEQEMGRPRTFIVTQTAYTRWNCHDSFLSDGFDGFIAKPLLRDELEAAVVSCLSKSRTM